MSIKIVIGTKSGKTFQKELTKEESEALYGKSIGDEFNGEIIGLTGYKLVISGGSDRSGFPMRKDIPGVARKRILIGKSVGFKGKLRGKRFRGLRVKKTVVGNTVSENINQLNVKVIKEGKEKLESIFNPSEDANKE